MTTWRCGRGRRIRPLRIVLDEVAGDVPLEGQPGQARRVDGAEPLLDVGDAPLAAALGQQVERPGHDGDRPRRLAPGLVQVAQLVEEGDRVERLMRRLSRAAIASLSRRSPSSRSPRRQAIAPRSAGQGIGQAEDPGVLREQPRASALAGGLGLLEPAGGQVDPRQAELGVDRVDRPAVGREALAVIPGRGVEVARAAARPRRGC